MFFTDIFIKRPILATVVSLLIFFVGFRALMDLPIRQYPKVESAMITVQTTYPGAAPDYMQGFITQPIEQAISSTEGIDYVTASSTQGRSNITVYLRLNYDADAALTEVLSKVQQVKNQIPREANDPVVQKQSNQGPAGILFIAFSSDVMKPPQIADYVSRTVVPILETVPGVGSVDVAGGGTFAMRLWLDPERMAARGITGEDVQNALLANNVQAAPGQTKGYFTIGNIEVNTGLEDVDQFRDMVVKAQNDSIVRMKDIATVDLDQQSVTQSGWIDGRRAVMLLVNSTPTGNPLSIVKDLRVKMAQISRDLPPALHMGTVYDATLYIQASIDEVTRTLAEAVAIVVVVVFVSLGTLRSVVIPIVTIPLSIVGSAALMLAAGFSINMLTLLAMVLAIGLVVDDAIVVVENVHRHIREGLTPVQAALVGAREIVGPVVAMTITLAAVYAPIGFLGGLTGVLFREFAFTLAGSVLISGIVALTLSPMMASLMLTQQEGRFEHWVEHAYDRFTKIYGRLLEASLNYRSATLLFAAVVLGSIFFLYTDSRSELAPPEDQGFVFGMVKGPQYANLDYTDAYTHQMELLARTIPELERRVNFNGFSGGGGGAGPNNGMFVFHFKPWDERTRTASQVQRQLQDMANQVTGIRLSVLMPSSLPGSIGGPPAQMVITSIDGYESIFRVMEQIKAEARKSGLFAYVDSDLDFNTPTTKLKIDHAKANNLGVSMSSIANTLAALVGENYVNRFNLNGRSYEVIPQVPRSSRLSADQLTKFYVATASGQQIPLSTLVSVENTTEPNALVEYNQLNSATFQAVPLPEVTMGQAVDFMESAAKRLLPAEFGHDYLSDARQYVTEGNSLVMTFVFALLVIYLVLAAQFESARDPLVILVSVPMSICGALIPLFFGGLFQMAGLEGATVNIYSQVGLVTLIGLISKHGILMVAFANDLQRSHRVDRRTAIQEAACIRLRPILMTTAAMVLGVVPLLAATGAGAASRFSIGLVIASGMTVGTLFTLFVLPAVYTFLAEDHRAGVNSLRNREIAALGTNVKALG
ncbi:MAG TPA: efflux RND transporter permease subunit [Alphaproteobacteria bacterium]|nr:efflux RND transporter permease subunit [Alphaproteobacteria bacterium]